MPQKLVAWMLTWPWSLMMAHWCCIVSSDRGCNSGSVGASWHTLAKSWAVRSHNSLWHWKVRSQLLAVQITVNWTSEPQTYSGARWLSYQPYTCTCRSICATKCRFTCTQQKNSLVGRVVSQCEDSFQIANSTNHFLSSDRDFTTMICDLNSKSWTLTLPWALVVLDMYHGSNGGLA